MIRSYVGIAPKEKTLAEAAAMRAALQPGFEGRARQPLGRGGGRTHYVETPDGLALALRPTAEGHPGALRPPTAPAPDLWPAFDALAGLPVALIRFPGGENSNILSRKTTDRDASPPAPT